jgi:hypothetical protein
MARCGSWYRNGRSVEAVGVRIIITLPRQGWYSDARRQNIACLETFCTGSHRVMSPLRACEPRRWSERAFPIKILSRLCSSAFPLCKDKVVAMKTYGGVNVCRRILECSASRLCYFTPGKEPPVLIVEESGWASQSVWTIWRSEHSWHYRHSNSGHSVAQPVASRCTDCATAAVIPSPHRQYKLLTLCSASFLHAPIM